MFSEESEIILKINLSQRRSKCFRKVRKTLLEKTLYPEAVVRSYSMK